MPSPAAGVEGGQSAPSADTGAVAAAGAVEGAESAPGTGAGTEAPGPKSAAAEDAKPAGAKSGGSEPGTAAAPKPAAAEPAEPAEPVAPTPVAAEDATPAAPPKRADAEPTPVEVDDAEGAKPGAPKPVDAKGAKAAAPTAANAGPAEPTAPASADAKPGTPAAPPKPADAEDAKPAESKPVDVEPTAPKPVDAEDAKPGAPKPVGAGSAQAAAPTPADAKPAAPKAADPAKPAGGKPGAQGVDQPTAVFKAVAPPVDQPTTMLKSPAAKDSGAKDSGAKDRAAAKGRAEAEAERTSRFVPLRALDSKAAPTPGAATAAAAAGGAQSADPAAPERTTQQPLPPKPPLDLLAELTNTPPPPETRVRTTVRRVKIWTPLVLLLIVVFAVVQTVRPLPSPTLDLTAKESVSFEGGKPSVPWPGQGQAAMDVNGIGTFGTSGAQKPVPIASIAKVMSVYLILRDHPLKTGEKGPKIPVDAAAQKHYETGKAGNESVVKVTEGQQLTEYEALQAVMLPSANNVAKLLARWDTGSSSEDQFVDKMNKTAKELGMKNTTYTDPSGLDKTTVSTAADLVKLGRAAMENPVFKEISRQPSYVDLNGDKQNNFFGLVPTVAIGIKTGTTTAAGGNILFAAEKQVGGKTQTIIGAALGQYGRNGTANIDEVTGVVRKLIESGQDALTAKTIVKKGDVVGEVDDGLGSTTPVVATKDVTAVGWSGLTVRLALDEKKGVTIPHTAKAGTEVGVLSVGDGKNDAVEVPVALQKDLAEPGFGAKIKRVA